MAKAGELHGASVLTDAREGGSIADDAALRAGAASLSSSAEQQLKKNFIYHDERAPPLVGGRSESAGRVQEGGPTGTW